jgi:hypothetical protein
MFDLLLYGKGIVLFAVIWLDFLILLTLAHSKTKYSFQNLAYCLIFLSQIFYSVAEALNSNCHVKGIALNLFQTTSNVLMAMINAQQELAWYSSNKRMFLLYAILSAFIMAFPWSLSNEPWVSQNGTCKLDSNNLILVCGYYAIHLFVSIMPMVTCLFSLAWSVSIKPRKSYFVLFGSVPATISAFGLLTAELYNISDLATAITLQVAHFVGVLFVPIFFFLCHPKTRGRTMEFLKDWKSFTYAFKFESLQKSSSEEVFPLSINVKETREISIDGSGSLSVGSSDWADHKLTSTERRSNNLIRTHSSINMSRDDLTPTIKSFQ